MNSRRQFQLCWGISFSCGRPNERMLPAGCLDTARTVEVVRSSSARADDSRTSCGATVFVWRTCLTASCCAVILLRLTRTSNAQAPIVHFGRGGVVHPLVRAGSRTVGSPAPIRIGDARHPSAPPIRPRNVCNLAGLLLFLYDKCGSVPCKRCVRRYCESVVCRRIDSEHS